MTEEEKIGEKDLGDDERAKLKEEELILDETVEKSYEYGD